jgi:glycerol-3-phosphate dehydrogenase
MLPNGRILSRSQIQQHLPGLDQPNISGGVMWHDAQIQNTERLLLSFLLSAAAAGAHIANYVGAVGYLRQGQRIIGAAATDELTGKTVSIRASMVVNAAGPWIDELLGNLNGQAPEQKFHLSTAMNLITRQLLPDYAVGLTSYYDHPQPDGTTEQRSRVLFIAPWREYSLVGTLHAPYNGRPNDHWLTETTIADFVAEVNRAYPGAALKREDVYQTHRGFLPMIPNDDDPARVKLVRESQVYDHAAEDGIDGLITAVGVKYTTARYLAEKTVDLLFTKLKRPSPPCQTRCTPLVTKQTMAAETAVNQAQIIHAIHNEMAQKLSDIVLRRTDMGSAAPPTPDALHTCAQIMAAECGWNETRTAQEIKDVWAAYQPANSQSPKKLVEAHL